MKRILLLFIVMFIGVISYSQDKLEYSIKAIGYGTYNIAVGEFNIKSYNKDYVGNIVIDQKEEGDIKIEFNLVNQKNSHIKTYKIISYKIYENEYDIYSVYRTGVPEIEYYDILYIPNYKGSKILVAVDKGTNVNGVLNIFAYFISD